MEASRYFLNLCVFPAALSVAATNCRTQCSLNVRYSIFFSPLIMASNGWWFSVNLRTLGSPPVRAPGVRPLLPRGAGFLLTLVPFFALFMALVEAIFLACPCVGVLNFYRVASGSGLTHLSQHRNSQWGIGVELFLRKTTNS